MGDYEESDLINIPFEEPHFVMMIYTSEQRMRQVLLQDNFLKGIYINNGFNLILPSEEFIKLGMPITQYLPFTYPIYVSRMYPEQTGDIILYNIGHHPDSLIGKFGINTTNHQPYLINITESNYEEAYENVLKKLNEYMEAQLSYLVQYIFGRRF